MGEGNLNYIKYILDGKNKRIKVKLVGKVRKQILTEIHNTIWFLPEPIKEYLPKIKCLIIRKAKPFAKGEVIGTFHNRTLVIELLDKKCME